MFMNVITLLFMHCFQKKLDKCIATNKMIINKLNLWYINMYICINTPNEIIRPWIGTCTLMIFLDQVLTVNKIYGTGLNIYEQMLIHVLLRFLEQLLHFKKNLCIIY